MKEIRSSGTIDRGIESMKNRGIFFARPRVKRCEGRFNPSLVFGGRCFYYFHSVFVSGAAGYKEGKNNCLA